MIERFSALDKKPREYRWTLRLPKSTDWIEWELRCEWDFFHGSITVTPTGTFKCWTRKTLHGLEPEFDTHAEAVKWVMDTLGLEVQE